MYEIGVEPIFVVGGAQSGESIIHRGMPNVAEFYYDDSVLTAEAPNIH